MAKKDKDEVESVGKPLAPITAEFNREDLNALRDAVNELIARQN